MNRIAAGLAALALVNGLGMGVAHADVGQAVGYYCHTEKVLSHGPPTRGGVQYVDVRYCTRY